MRSGGGGHDEDARRGLPSVDRLLQDAGVQEWVRRYGRVAVVEAIRASLAEVRAEAASPASTRELLSGAADRLKRSTRRHLRKVLNGTGVILHTNLGRAPLSASALAAIAEAAGGYCNLEYDLEGGGRGDRYSHCVERIRSLTGSEDALVVNNNAAAVALTVSTFARGRDVIVSRGELVEIGGSFRLPEVIERAGACLVEVGTTNRTRIGDYARAITPSTGMLLKVHASNYRVVGFTEEASLAELAELGEQAGVPVAHDLGSGQLLVPPGAQVAAEPHPRRSVEAGATVVMWSGDKLLGGPQAGILHGTADAVSRLRGNPLLRALRVDKMTLAALEDTLRAYADPELATGRIPALRMLAELPESVEERARRARERLPAGIRDLVRVVSLRSLVGGGTLPDAELTSAGWRIESSHAERLAERCRVAEPPLVGRIEEGAFVVDFRTLAMGEEADAARALKQALGEPEEAS